MFRVRDIIDFLGDPFTEGEYRLTLHSLQVYDSGMVPGPATTFEVENGDDTAWVYAGQGSLEEMKYVKSIVLRVSGVEMDWPDADDVFRTFETELTLNHSALLAAHSARQYGLIEEFSWFTGQEFADSAGGIFFTVQARVLLGVR